jgi:hypothetical protein
MSSLVSRKKAELAAKVQRLQERHASLSAALDSSGSDSQQGPGGSGAVTEAEWKAKYDAVKAQLPGYKAMKRELAELEAEVCVLLYDNIACRVPWIIHGPCQVPYEL